MCIKFVLWRRSLFSSSKAIVVSILLIFIFFASNFHLNFTIKFENIASENVTLIRYLVSSNMLKIWFHVRKKVFSGFSSGFK
jgi:hypothetical protein